jgi:hypothetical protein
MYSKMYGRQLPKSDAFVAFDASRSGLPRRRSGGVVGPHDYPAQLR